MKKQSFHIKITFEENEKVAATIIFNARQELTHANLDVTLDATGDNLAVALAKHLQGFINEKLRILENTTGSVAKA